MKFKLKVTSFCILFIFLFVGCSKTGPNVSTENKSSGAEQKVLVSKSNDKDTNKDKNEDTNKKAAENDAKGKNKILKMKSQKKLKRLRKKL